MTAVRTEFRRPAKTGETAGTAASGDNGSGLPTLAIVKWAPVLKNTLRGFCSVQNKDGQIVHNVAVHLSHGRPWASPPARPTNLRDEHGKQIWELLVDFKTRELRNQWSEAVIGALLDEHPNALEPDEL